MRLARVIGGLTLAAALLAPGTARADIFAAVDVTGADGSPDVAVMNATTGGRLTLPAGVNTAAQELHPSISSDGKRLSFLRIDQPAGTTRVIAVDLGTGQSADLFSGFEVAQRRPVDPAMAPDGRSVFTAGRFVHETLFFSDIVVTGLENFPGGPFSRLTNRIPYGFTNDGRTTQPSAGGGLFLAFGEQHLGTEGEVILARVGGGASNPLTRAGHTYSHPALPAGVPEQVLLVDRTRDQSSGVAGPGDIVFRPASTSTFPGTPTELPSIVNTGDESLPAFTPDSRYVGFVRRSGGHNRLFVWDSQTQTLLNASGVELGTLETGASGNLSLYPRSLFAFTAVNASGLVTANLLHPSLVGLFVQRIAGKRRVLGRRAFRLRTVGRVPLGSFRRGHLRTHWTLKVNGKRLRPGRYLVTVRAVTRKRVVRELGKPRVLRVRRR